MAIAGVMLFTVSYARTESVRGALVPAAGLVEIVPTRAGTVVRVDVEEGAQVTPGQPLVAVLAEERTLTGSQAQSRVLTALSYQKAEIENQSVALARGASAEQRGFGEQIEGLRSEVRKLQAQIDGQGLLVGIATRDLDQASVVAQRGFISKRDITQREEALIVRQQQLSALEQLRDAKLSSILQLRQAGQRAKLAATSTRSNLASLHAQIEQQSATLDAQQGYLIASPIEGRISNLVAHRGDRASTEASMMTIVPKGGTLHARMLVPARAIGFIKPGLAVRLSFDTFPVESFGSMDGVVATVSSAPTVEKGASGSNEPMYIATATVTGRLSASGTPAPAMIPGMTFTASIVTARQPLAKWLFGPLFTMGRK